MTTPAQYVSTGIAVSFSTLVAELIDVDHGGETEEVVKCPNQSGGYIKKVASGNQDAGSITLLVGFDPDNAVLPALGTKADLTITWPAPATNHFKCSAILKKKRGVNAKLGTRIVENLEFELSGTPDWAYVPTP